MNITFKKWYDLIPHDPMIRKATESNSGHYFIIKNDINIILAYDQSLFKTIREVNLELLDDGIVL
jgi:hypothetical protein